MKPKTKIESEVVGPFLETSFNYRLGRTSLLRVVKEKDLGIIVTYNLKWNTHIQMLTSKANKMLGFQKRTCPLLTKDKSNQALIIPLACKLSVMHPMVLKSGLLRLRYTRTSNQMDSSIEDG